jgi:hypothetical protein
VSSAVDEIGDDVLWNGSEEDGTVRGECEEDADTAKAYIIYHSLCKKCMKLIVKYFFLADILFLGGHLSFGNIHFPWQTCFILGVILDYSRHAFGYIRY